MKGEKEEEEKSNSNVKSPWPRYQIGLVTTPQCLGINTILLFAIVQTCIFKYFFNEFIKYCIFHSYIWYEDAISQHKIYQKLNLKISLFGKMAENLGIF